jgi:phytoene dehydrogenase-like protein
MSDSYDAVVIGAGHNGLVCANYLARSGLKVAVLERRPIVGGAAVTEEIAPGFRASIFSYLMSLLHPRIIRDFDLKALGVEVLPCSDMVSPVSDTDYIVFSDNMAKTQASFAKFSRRDAEIYPAFDAYLREATAIVRQLLWETPFDPAKRDWRTFRDATSFLWRYRRVGRNMYRIVDLLTMSAYDFLKEWF